MAAVLVHDERHDREVAVKVLAEALAAVELRYQRRNHRPPLGVTITWLPPIHCPFG